MSYLYIINIAYIDGDTKEVCTRQLILEGIKNSRHLGEMLIEQRARLSEEGASNIFIKDINRIDVPLLEVNTENGRPMI